MIDHNSNHAFIIEARGGQRGKNVVALMLHEYENFTKSEKKIVDYILNTSGDAYISITV